MSKPRQYRPSIERLKADYNRRLARARMLKNWRRGRPAPAKPAFDMDNSEPWIAGGPKSFTDSIFISDSVAAIAEKWTTTLAQ